MVFYILVYYFISI